VRVFVCVLVCVRTVEWCVTAGIFSQENNKMKSIVYPIETPYFYWKQRETKT